MRVGQNLSIIVAVDRTNGIGKDNRLLWHLPSDMKFFKEKTSGHVVIMGRLTFDSIGKPLKNRKNIILSKNENLKVEGCEVINSIPNCLEHIRDEKSEVFVIGGSSIYEQTLPYVNTIYMTKVDGVFNADRFFPDIEKSNQWEQKEQVHFEKDETNPYSFSIITFQKKVNKKNAYKDVNPLNQFNMDLVTSF